MKVYIVKGQTNNKIYDVFQSQQDAENWIQEFLKKLDETGFRWEFDPQFSIYARELK